MRTNSNFEHFRNTRPDFPRSKPNKRRYHNSAKPNEVTSPPSGETIKESKPNYSIIALYAAAFTLGVVIGLLI